jgi:hypothetical protein
MSAAEFRGQSQCALLQEIIRKIAETIFCLE